jgi:hypothetical protein
VLWRSLVWLLVHRRDNHPAPVVGEDKFETTDPATIDPLGLRVLVASGDQLATNGRAAGRATPGHLMRNELYATAHWRVSRGEPVELAAANSYSKLRCISQARCRIVDLTASEIIRIITSPKSVSRLLFGDLCDFDPTTASG